MMELKNQKMSYKIDWDALDNGWADQYEEDYGNHFSRPFFHNHIPAQAVLAGMA